MENNYTLNVFPRHLYDIERFCMDNQINYKIKEVKCDLMGYLIEFTFDNDVDYGKVYQLWRGI